MTGFAIRALEVVFYAYLLAGLMLFPLLIVIASHPIWDLPKLLVAKTWGWFAVAIVAAAFLGRVIAQVTA